MALINNVDFQCGWTVGRCVSKALQDNRTTVQILCFCLMYACNCSAESWEFTINIYLIRCGESYVDMVRCYLIR